MHLIILNMKTCSRCKIEKDFVDFNNNKNTKDGLQHSCKYCVKQHYEANKEKIYTYRKQYHLDNKDKINEYRRKQRKQKYKVKNPNINKLELFIKEETARIKIKEDNDFLKTLTNEKKEDFNLIINKELSNSISKAYNYGKLNKSLLSDIFLNVSNMFYCTKCKSPKESNRYNIAETILRARFIAECLDCKSERHSTYGYKSDCEVRREIFRIRSVISRGFRNKIYKKGKRTTEILGCSFDYFREYIIKDSKYNLLQKDIQLDHIVPVSLASTIEEVYALNHYSNFELLSAIDNREKGNRFTNDKSLNKLVALHYNYNMIKDIIKRNNLEIKRV